MPDFQLTPSAPPPARHALPIGAALGVALLGSLLWAGIAHVTGYEYGYAAIGLGVLVGGAAFVTGGRGPLVAGVAAIATLGSIAGGKLLTAELYLRQALDETRDEFCTQEGYEEACADARLWSHEGSNPSDEAVLEFMVVRGFTISEAPAAVPAEDLAFFQEVSRPMLEWHHEAQPSFEEWRDELTATLIPIARSEVGLVDQTIESLGPLDVLFALLALSTAVGMVRRGSQETNEHGEVVLFDSAAERIKHEAAEQRRAA